VARGLRDALTLRHLHSSGADCTSAEEVRAPWRRVWHHCTFYGFLLCFASTSVAAIYHSVFGWQAPYPYTSAPVILGTVGGLGLVAGPIGLLWQRRTRDPALVDDRQSGLDESFIVLLTLTSLTGLLLVALRETALMPPLLLVHLGVVLALFVALPYGKFVHGAYRAAALIMSARDRSS
jgi:citrate/tricarballylate utilization protein